MSAQSPPAGPYLVRARGEMWLAPDYPDRSHGRVAFWGYPARYNEHRQGYSVSSYVLKSQEPVWVDIDGRGAQVSVPKNHVPAELRPAALKVAA